ncbi:MAG: SdrD B-like domain-containing protein [Puniceicoccaceae bacterium]
MAANRVTIEADGQTPVTTPPVSITARASDRSSVEKVLLGSGIPLNENVTYRVRARNQNATGALDLTGVVLIDTLPAGTEVVNAGGGVHDPAANTVTWDVGGLDAGETATRTLTVRFPDTAFAVGDTVVNHLEMTGTPLGGAPFSKGDQTSHSIELPSSSANFRKGVDGKFVYEGKEAGKTWSFTLANDGNVPMADVSVTDVIPDEVEVTRIRVPRLQGTPAGLNDRVSVFYETNASGGWIGLGGNPYGGTSSSWVDVSGLGLGAGEYITAVRWDFGTLPVGYEVRDFQIRGTILTVDRSGTPVPEGRTVNNTATLSYTDHTGAPRSATDDGNVTVKSVRPVVQLAKSDSPDPVADGGVVTYTVELENHPLAAQDMVEPVLADLLDAGLVYVPGSARVLSKPAGAPDPHFEAIGDYNGTGRTLLRWSWTSAHATAYDLKIGEKFEISFDAEVPDGTIYGNIPNRIHLADWRNAEIDAYNGVSSATDADDLDADSDTGETIFHKQAATRVAGRASMDSIKWVFGQLDSEWSRFPESGETVPGGLADYRLIVENTGNVPIEDAEILDILPIIGDTGVVDLSERDTEWIAALAGPATAPAGVTVYYSRSANPERPDYNSGVVDPEDPDWSTTPPATITEARSLLFVFDGLTIRPGERFELNWPMRAPVGTPTDGRIAWNSFGYKGTRVDTGSELLPSEPNQVGIKVRPDENASYGDYVWLDVNRDGIQDPGEPGLNGIRVDFYEDGPVGGFGDGDRDPSTDRHVGFTVTSDDFDGDPGFYLFPDLDRGEYYAVFSVPDSYTITVPNAGPDDALDSDVGTLAPAGGDAGDRFTDGAFTKALTPITDLDAMEHDRSWDLGLWLPPTGVDIVKTAGTAADGEDLWILPGTPVTYTYTVFPLRAVIGPHPDGMEISWNSAAGYTYHVERSTAPGAGWVDISGPLPSAPPENVFVDNALPAGGAVFYRVWGTK